MERLIETLSQLSGASAESGGSVGVVGGSVGFTGQPSLVGLAALRTGTDDARVLVPEPIYPVVASHSPNLLVSRYPGERFTEDVVDEALALADGVDAYVVGPGLGDPDSAAVRETIQYLEVPTVVDAAAIDLPIDADLSNTIFTPDSAEGERIEAEYGSIESFSEETGAAVVLTGNVDTIVANGDRWENETGTSALTVAGTGDTMTGIVASLLGQGVDREEAAELGAWIVGKAGELATARYGDGVVATDVIEQIPDIVR